MINNGTVDNLTIEQENYSSFFDTAMRADAFAMDDDTKIDSIKNYKIAYTTFKKQKTELSKTT